MARVGHCALCSLQRRLAAFTAEWRHVSGPEWLFDSASMGSRGAAERAQKPSDGGFGGARLADGSGRQPWTTLQSCHMADR